MLTLQLKPMHLGGAGLVCKRHPAQLPATWPNSGARKEAAALCGALQASQLALSTAIIRVATLGRTMSSGACTRAVTARRVAALASGGASDITSAMGSSLTDTPPHALWL